jgi:hypothetical protein
MESCEAKWRGLARECEDAIQTLKGQRDAALVRTDHKQQVIEHLRRDLVEARQRLRQLKLRELMNLVENVDFEANSTVEVVDEDEDESVEQLRSDVLGARIVLRSELQKLEIMKNSLIGMQEKISNLRKTQDVVVLLKHHLQEAANQAIESFQLKSMQARSLMSKFSWKHDR